MTTSDEHGITEEKFEAAKAHLLERYGSIPPSLQSVIDRGGRFRLAAVIIEDDPPRPAVFDERDLAVIAMHEDDAP